MPADPTNMRDRIAESATQWALMYPLANWPWLGRRVGEDEHLDAIAKNLAAAWGRDIADAVTAVFADLGHTDACVHPDQHAAVIREWEDSKAEVERLRFEEKHLRAELAKADAENNAAGQRAEQAEAAIAHARRMAQVWIDIRPTYPTATGEGLAMAYAGEQILATFDRPTDRSACPRCDGAGAEPGTEEWNDIAHMHDPHTGEPCSACNGTGKAPTDTTGETP
jgi:hypothetical protein